MSVGGVKCLICRRLRCNCRWEQEAGWSSGSPQPVLWTVRSGFKAGVSPSPGCFTFLWELHVGTIKGANHAGIAMASVPSGHLCSLVTPIAGFRLFFLLTSCCFVLLFDGVHSIFTAGLIARFNYFDRQKQKCFVLLYTSLSLGD